MLGCQKIQLTSLVYALFAIKVDPVILRQVSQWHMMLVIGGPVNSYRIFSQTQLPVITFVDIMMIAARVFSFELLTQVEFWIISVFLHRECGRF